MAGDISIGVLVTWIMRDMADGSFWIDVLCDGEAYGSLGPFESEEARQKAHEEITEALRSQGATDVPIHPQ